MKHDAIWSLVFTSFFITEVAKSSADDGGNAEFADSTKCVKKTSGKPGTTIILGLKGGGVVVVVFNKGGRVVVPFSPIR